jgi:hypothetical protein
MKQEGDQAKREREPWATHAHRYVRTLRFGDHAVI